jgi:hypothetical protein
MSSPSIKSYYHHTLVFFVSLHVLNSVAHSFLHVSFFDATSDCDEHGGGDGATATGGGGAGDDEGGSAGDDEGGGEGDDEGGGEGGGASAVARATTRAAARVSEAGALELASLLRQGLWERAAARARSAARARAAAARAAALSRVTSHWARASAAGGSGRKQRSRERGAEKTAALFYQKVRLTKINSHRKRDR